jgi:hypothetical protein
MGEPDYLVHVLGTRGPQLAHVMTVSAPSSSEIATSIE